MNTASNRQSDPALRPVAELDASGLIGVLTDIDDTLTTDGRLSAAAYQALWRLREAGLLVIPITGRSAGWAHMALKTWPIDAVVAESGGLYMARVDRGDRIGLETVLHSSAQAVMADRAAVAACGQAILQAIPGLREASDNAYRRVDYALDYCEEVERVDTASVALAIDRFRAAGFNARASSVHINAWRGDFDKAPMTVRLLDERFADRGGHDLRRWLFVGDAPNDASMFSAFPVSVGVANLRPVLDQLPTPPAFLTQASHGAGFVELTNRILEHRR